MKFLLDANVPRSCAESIRRAGHTAADIRDIMPAARDEEVLRYAKENEFLVITRDLGFGNPLLHPAGSHSGVVILRLPNTFTAKQISVVLEEFLKDAAKEGLAGAVTIVELGRYRIRQQLK